MILERGVFHGLQGLWQEGEDPGGQKRSSFVSRVENLGAPKPQRKSKGQDSTKVHNTKGKNNHGRTKW